LLAGQKLHPSLPLAAVARPQPEGGGRVWHLLVGWPTGLKVGPARRWPARWRRGAAKINQRETMAERARGQSDQAWDLRPTRAEAETIQPEWPAGSSRPVEAKSIGGERSKAATIGPAAGQELPAGSPAHSTCRHRPQWDGMRQSGLLVGPVSYRGRRATQIIMQSNLRAQRTQITTSPHWRPLDAAPNPVGRLGQPASRRERED